LSSNIPIINQDDDLSSIIEKSSKAGSHRLIVVDSEGKAVGLISDSDVIVRVQPEILEPADRFSRFTSGLCDKNDAGRRAQVVGCSG
jgi:CBS domain containing-hemolysin-like protein